MSVHSLQHTSLAHGMTNTADGMALMVACAFGMTFTLSFFLHALTYKVHAHHFSIPISYIRTPFYTVINILRPLGRRARGGRVIVDSSAHASRRHRLAPLPATTYAAGLTSPTTTPAQPPPLPPTRTSSSSPAAPRPPLRPLRPWTALRLPLLTDLNVVLRPLGTRVRGGRVMVDPAAHDLRRLEHVPIPGTTFATSFTLEAGN